MDDVARLELRIAELEERVAAIETTKRGRRFKPPSVDDVRAHCVEKGYTFDPEQFVAFYEAKGWMIGSSKMKKWESACVTWQKRAGNGQGRQSNQPVGEVARIHATIDGRARARAEAIQSGRGNVHEGGASLETP